MVAIPTVSRDTNRYTLRIVGLSLTLALLSIPALAQGGGHGKGGGGGQDKGAGQGQGGGQGKGQGAAKKADQSDQRGQGQAKSQGSPRSNDLAQGSGKGQGKAKESPGRGNASQDDGNRGRGNDGDRDNRGQSRGLGVAAGSDDNPGARGRSNARFIRAFTPSEVHPSVRKFVVSDRFPDRIAGGALARAQARGIKDNVLTIVPNGNAILVRNRSGVTLVDLDEQRARNLGAWDVDVLNDEVKGNAPSFCRSGAGHPVWGRQWCLDKGFGLGTTNDWRWGRTSDLGDLVFLRPVDPAAALTRNALANLLGNVVTDRLALHAITLGLVDPLVGKWFGEPSGPQVLLVSSGTQPVAEIVDINRDNRGDLMLVGLRPW